MQGNFEVNTLRGPRTLIAAKDEEYGAAMTGLELRCQGRQAH